MVLRRRKIGAESLCNKSEPQPRGRPTGIRISFRLTDERYWSDPATMKATYADRPADKRPVWVIQPNGSNAQVVECLKFECAIDGSRAA